MERETATKFVHELLDLLVKQNGSDLFITGGFPPAVKIDGRIAPVSKTALTPQHTIEIVRSVMNDKQAAEFEATKECNFAISPPGIGRFRCNAFVQMGRVGMVMRTINTTIPTFDELSLPPVLKDVCMSKRGIMMFVAEARRSHLLMDLSLNIRAFVAQRLIARRDGRGRVPAVEVMLSSPLISDLVFKGDVSGIKEIMKKSRELGMQTFDQALFELYEAGMISYEDALRNADSLNDLRLEIKLHGKDAKNRNVMAGIGNLDIVQ